MVFNQEFEFYVKIFFTLLFRNSIFLPSDALLSSIMQNYKKSLSFPDHLSKGLQQYFFQKNYFALADTQFFMPALRHSNFGHFSYSAY